MYLRKNVSLTGAEHKEMVKTNYKARQCLSQTMSKFLTLAWGQLGKGMA